MRKFTTPIIDVKKYGGKQVAIVRGKIVASGIATSEVLAKARREVPRSQWDEITLLVVPRGITVVYLLLRAGLFFHTEFVSEKIAA